MKSIAIASLFAVVASYPLLADQPDHDSGTDLGNPTPGAAYEGSAFQFYKICDNDYHAVGTGELSVIATAPSSSMRLTS